MFKRILIFMLLIFMNIQFAYSQVPLATDSRIKTYIYNKNDVYLVLISTGFQSSIEFQEGEIIKTVSLGESYSWSLTPVGSRLFIKPMENNVRTNMTIITNLRTYQFDIASRSEDESNTEVAYVVRFYYPPNK